MIFDQTGSLAGVSRHDYLPFGEELYAGVGGRTTGLGYTAGDGVRQKLPRTSTTPKPDCRWFLIMSSLDAHMPAPLLFDPELIS